MGAIPRTGAHLAHPSSEAPSEPDPRAGEDPRVAELVRRIETLERLDEESLGTFTRLDWWICTVLAVVLPVVVLWWFAG